MWNHFCVGNGKRERRPYSAPRAEGIRRPKAVLIPSWTKWKITTEEKQKQQLLPNATKGNLVRRWRPVLPFDQTRRGNRRALIHLHNNHHSSGIGILSSGKKNWIPLSQNYFFHIKGFKKADIWRVWYLVQKVYKSLLLEKIKHHILLLNLLFFFFFSMNISLWYFEFVFLSFSWFNCRILCL